MTGWNQLPKEAQDFIMFHNRASKLEAQYPEGVAGHECSWCGTAQPANPERRWYGSIDGIRFCSRYHRDASKRSLRGLLAWVRNAD